MSEVKRYTPDQLSGRTLAVVLSDDYNTLELEAVRLRADNQNYDRLLGRANINLDAAQSELAALREELADAKRVGPPHFCGLPMSLNPHPEAGVPGRFLEIGTVSECIPCLVSSRHGWAKTAGDLQQRLAAAEQRNATLTTLLREGLEEYKNGDDWIDRVIAALRNQPTESGASE